MSDFEKAVNAQRKFFAEGRTRNISFRIDTLKKLKTLINKYEPEIINALQLDLGRSGYESFISENVVAFDEINSAVVNLKKWASPKKVGTPIQLLRSKSQIVYEPLGLVLIISPWNFPFHLTFAPLAGAIAAGNCCIIKPSEASPNSSRVIAKIINDNFEPGHLLVYEGGHNATQSFLQFRFDHVFFTGSTRHGTEIYKMAAANLTPVTMELGGKCPCIIEPGINIKTAAKRIAWGKFLNAGQTCLAPDYLLLSKKVADEFLTEFMSTVESFYGKTPLSNNDWPRMINQHHFNRGAGLLKSGKIIFGGNINSESLKIEPTIISEISVQSPIMCEEIFGPILPVIEYTVFDEAIAIINSLSKPLVVYAFTDNDNIRSRIINETSSGAVSFNECLMHGANGNLPFGGVGDSGIGRYHHRFSFETFSNAKSVFSRSFWPDPNFRYPPYKEKDTGFMKKFI
jgi:aldehyde dehydrogenase (NAD+)